MHTNEDNTAVFHIRKTFDEIMSCQQASTRSSIKLNFDTSLSDSTGLSSKQAESFLDDRSFQARMDLISAKSHLNQLQIKLDSSETSRKRARIEHDKEVEQVKSGCQRELDKVSELKHQLIAVAAKEESTKQIFNEFKKKAEKSIADLQQRINEIQKEKTTIEDGYRELKQESRSKISELKNENAQLTNAMLMKQNEISEVKQLLQMAKRDAEELNRKKLEVADLHSKLSASKQETKELELALSRAEEDVKVGKAMRAQLNRVGELEIENAKLSKEVQYLRAVQDNVLVLKEECESLRKKLERADERCMKLGSLEIVQEDLRKKLSEWEKLECFGQSGLKTPQKMSRHLAELQRDNELLLEKNGQLQSSVHSLDGQVKSLKQQLQTQQSELFAERLKVEQAMETAKRINKKMVLIAKEKDGYKSIIDSYESEVTSVGRQDITMRQTLEEALEATRRHANELETERNQLSELLTQIKTRAHLLERQVLIGRESAASTAEPLATSFIDQTIAVELREKVASLEKRVESLSDEKENLLAQMEKRDMQGDYDGRQTKVIHYSMNPFAMAQRRQATELERLRNENERLSNRLKIIEDFGGRVDDLTAKVDVEMAHPSMSKAVEEMKAQLTSAELKNQRLMEAFKKTSLELRAITLELLGYQIDIPKTGHYRLQNMYAESQNDNFIFMRESSSTSSGVLQMLSNEYSASFSDSIETYLNGANSIPAFLSSVTLELFKRQTMMMSRC